MPILRGIASKKFNVLLLWESVNKHCCTDGPDILFLCHASFLANLMIWYFIRKISGNGKFTA